MSDRGHYRAYLFDPAVDRAERPVMEFFTSQRMAEAWAQEKLNTAGLNAEVWLYQIEETLVGSWKAK